MDEATAARRKTGFNPVLGFLPAATMRLLYGEERPDLFQSRAGFSPCRDAQEVPDVE